MRIRYSELIGKMVVDSSGARVGRIRDLLAERRGDALRVTAILVGEAALLQRIAFKPDVAHRFLRTPEPSLIPWSLVDHIDARAVCLRASREHAVRREAPRSDNVHAPGTATPRENDT